jgi:intracellular sulfur oxidation DsrE/DsrF family protein
MTINNERCTNKEHDMTSPDKPLHVDIPVKLDDVKVVFSVENLALQGDLPASIIHLQVITSDIANWNATSEVVAVFHTNAGHVTLHDNAYNTERNIKTGNPYKELIASLIRRGVHVELCGATARVHHWGNEDLLPGIKVNTNAGARMVQLVQQGFVKITEA